MNQDRQQTPVAETIWFRGNCATAEETATLARKFADMLQPGDVVAFYGNLGSGKTYFIKALCQAWQCAQEATSPTFTIINEYTTRQGVFVYHFDFYRLESEAELMNLGLEEFFYNDYICLIEWADKIEKYLPPQRWEVYLDFLPEHPDARAVKIVKREPHE